MEDNIELKEKSNIIFSIGEDLPEEYLKLESGYFWYRGEKIVDVENAYDRFCLWLKTAEKKVERNENV